MTLFHKLCSILNLPWMGRKEKRLGEDRIVVRIAGLDFDLTYAHTAPSGVQLIAKRMLRRDAEITRLRKNRKRWKHLEAIQAEDARWIMRQSKDATVNEIYDGI